MTTDSPHPFRKTFDQIIKAAKPIYDQFMAESDRGAILVGTSLLDGTLEDLIRSVLVSDSSVQNDLFRPSGPLGSFSSRLKVAYLFGLIDQGQFRTLNRVRDIRNHCAHSVTAITFDADKIRDNVANLRDVPPEFGPPEDIEVSCRVATRVRFLFNIAHQYVILRISLEWSSTLGRVSEDWMLPALSAAKREDFEKAFKERESALIKESERIE